MPLRNALVALALLAAAPALAQPPAVWIEAETARANVPLEARGWGVKALLSEEKWLQLSIDADKVAKDQPDGGILLTYPVTLAADADWEVWNRIGYEFARSTFQWRLDDGAWTEVSPDVLTTDLMTIETWNEVAWLKLGKVRLTAGAHTLQIRLPKRIGKDGKPERVLYASDALCLYPGVWHPDGPYQPGVDHRTDRDRKAAALAFALPAREPGKPQRTTLALNGDWEVCRADEDLPPADIARPMDPALPPEPHWSAIAVPSDKNVARPDLTFAHRLWYRTRVEVPASHAGRRFVLTFPRNNLNTTVVVNGVPCGFSAIPNTPVDIDITNAVKPGQVNEIRVGIRDAWYGYSASPTDPMKLRRKFNLPLSVVGGGFQDLAYPIWNAWQSGIVETPTLASVGRSAIADVFVQPDVAGKRLVVTYAMAAGHGLPRYEIVDARTGAIVRRERTRNAFIGGATTVREDFAFPEGKLWWPVPNPQLYVLRIVAGDDVSETRFGFRTWGSKGKDFTLNGQVWHGWADLNGGATPAEWLQNYRASGQRLMRLSGYAQGGPDWLGLTPSQALEFFDENGVVVRRSGDLDGEAIGYMAIEGDPELKKRYGTEIKRELIDHWRAQMVARVKAERNHPSIHVWSIENEWLYINCINLYGGLMDAFETTAAEVGAAVAAADPTRLWMTDGGGAGKANLFPVHGDHYVADLDAPDFLERALSDNPTGGGRGRWVWDRMRPRYLGEDYFATGINPADYAIIGGEANFVGKVQNRPTMAAVYRILTEGYRWAGFGAWHLWLGRDSLGGDRYGYATANAERAAFVRQRDSVFAPGQKLVRTVGLFNDSFDDAPMAFTRSLVENGKTLWTKTTVHNVAPGTSERFDDTIPLPASATTKIHPQAGTRAHRPAASRRSLSLVLTLSVGGKTVFRDAKPITLLTPPIASAPTLVYDPAGTLPAALRPAKAVSVRSLSALPKAGVLLIAPDALSESDATSPALAAWAAQGGWAIVLAQKRPLKWQALPTLLEPTGRSAQIAFVEDESHPALAHLASPDFFGGLKVRGAYVKPTRGAKSLLQCGPRLGQSALLEVPVGAGGVLLCQLDLDGGALSKTLLANLTGYARTPHAPGGRPVTATLSDPNLRRALDGAGVKFATTAVPTLNPGIALVEATPANLKRLAAEKAKVDAFQQAGGWLVLAGLTPEGLADYNKLVDFPHMIRPFGRERVTFPPKRSPLTAGLSAGDIVLSSGRRINGWTQDEYVADDAFTFVVDYDDVAPFGQMPPSSYFGYAAPDNDHDPKNAVNGFFSDDGWQLTFSLWAGSGPPRPVPFTFTQPQVLTEIEWAGNAFYYPTTKLALTFDGGRRTLLSVAPNNLPQTLALPPGPAASRVELQIVDWAKVKEPAVVGIDNVRLRARRPAEFLARARPLLNVGALMEYRRGAGGILLCNLRFPDRESVPENAAKKQRILGTLLRNLGASSTGAAGVIVGTPLRFAPVSLAGKANAFRNERGWPGDPQKTLAALPTGLQTFAGIGFDIYDFPTSPVPTCIVLGPSAERVGGIAVGKKADALFFLQTARIDQPSDGRRRYELARYVVTWADGRTETIPLYQDEDLADYRQAAPAALPGAQLGWSAPYPGGGVSAAAWVKQWNNPRPEIEIKEVSLEIGKDRRGVPALLAITAASRR